MIVGSVVKGAAFAAAAAAVGYVALATDEGRAADADLFATVNRARGPGVDRLFAGVTELGSLYAVGAATGALAGLGRPRLATRAFAAAGATWLLGQGVKKLVDRPRPYDADARVARRGRPSPASAPVAAPTA